MAQGTVRPGTPRPPRLHNGLVASRENCQDPSKFVWRAGSLAAPLLVQMHDSSNILPKRTQGTCVVPAQSHRSGLVSLPDMSAHFRRSLPFEPGAWAIWQKNPDVSAHVGSCLQQAGRQADPESLLPGRMQGGPGQCQVLTNGEALTSGVCCRRSPSARSRTISNPPNIEPWRQVVSVSASPGFRDGPCPVFPVVIASMFQLWWQTAPHVSAHAGLPPLIGVGTEPVWRGARSREYARDALVAADENCPYSLGPLPALVSWRPGLPTADRPRKRSRGSALPAGWRPPRPG